MLNIERGGSLGESALDVVAEGEALPRNRFTVIACTEMELMVGAESVVSTVWKAQESRAAVVMEAWRVMAVMVRVVGEMVAALAVETWAMEEATHTHNAPD